MRKFWLHPNTFLNGLLWLVGLAMQIGGWVSPPVAYGLFGIAFVWSIFTIVYWSKWRKREKLHIGTGKQDLDISKYLTDILAKMHKCTLKLKDKAVKQYVTLFKFKDFWELCNNMTTAMNEHKALLRKVKKDVGRKKLSKDMIEKRQQIDWLFDKLSPMIEEEWTLIEIVEWSHILDKLPNIQNAKYKGITKLREKDRRWNKLFSELNNMKVEFADIFVDKSLDKMIKDYLDYSFGGGGLQLLADLFNKFVPVEFQPSEFIKSGAYDPGVQIENHMTKLLEDITNRIKKDQPRENWIDAYEARYGKLPLLPAYLRSVCASHPIDQPVSKDMKFKTPSGQLWSSWTSTQREEWRQLVGWCGKNPDDYLAHMGRMLPKTPSGVDKIRWRPTKQR